MNSNKLFLDIHVLQTVPPSCVNRDDTGSPKTAIYGGVQRARVSSQAWKKAVRDMFKDGLIEPQKLGKRTTRVISMIAEKIKELEGMEHAKAQKCAQKLLETAGIKIKEGKSNENSETEMLTAALFFMSEAQAEAMARLAIDKPDAKKKEVQETLKLAPSIDVALFGRMVADDPVLNTDACVQVAHAISTHKVANEYDYFTAIDDLSPQDNAGAGMLGTVEYNSSTLYRYATVAIHQLQNTLGVDTLMAVECFLKAFVLSMPTGKQNTFANRTSPNALFVTLRKDQPVNLVGAFEKAIISREDGYVIPSVKALAKHAQDVSANWLAQPMASWVVGNGVDDLGTAVSFETLTTELHEELSSWLGLTDTPEGEE